MGQPYESGDPAAIAGAAKICAHCDKEIVLHPGTNRYRSTEHGLAVDRMRCESAPDGHYHVPGAQDSRSQEMRQIRPVVIHCEPEFRTGNLS